jgi:hypothetical protein
MEENTKLKILLREADPEIDIDIISQEEIICLKQISGLYEISERFYLYLDEVKKLEILQKTLERIRGKNQRVKKRDRTAGMSDDELTELARINE